jgi:hypothetical protein
MVSTSVFRAEQRDFDPWINARRWRNSLGEYCPPYSGRPDRRLYCQGNQFGHTQLNATGWRALFRCGWVDLSGQER